MEASARKGEEGLRERKRRETLQRISEVGLSLFLSKGYDATTLEEIATEAGISPRTFFYYFKSKDDIILAYVSGFNKEVRASITERGPIGSPLNSVEKAMAAVADRFATPKLMSIVRLMRESDALRTKNRNSSHLEDAIFEAICDAWPTKGRRDRLRLVAIASMGAMRVAVDAWLAQSGKRPLSMYLRDAFSGLKTEMSESD